MENNTLKDVKILYPTFFFKLSPLQINQFEPIEWAEEKTAIASLENTYLSYAAAKQVIIILHLILFNKNKYRFILINKLWKSNFHSLIKW